MQPPFQASKWLQIQALIDPNEMKSLFTELSPFDIYQVGSIVPRGTGKISQDKFLLHYSDYIESLKRGIIPPDITYKPYFSSILTCAPDHVFALPIREGQELLRVIKPSIQLQSHHLDYSSADGKFHSKVYGIDSILWGLQFSYPQLFKDPLTQEILNVDEQPLFPNTKLFKILQRWIRSYTIPTPFFVNNKKINVPMRLGKQCVEWINQHPQLQKRGIKVK